MLLVLHQFINFSPAGSVCEEPGHFGPQSTVGRCLGIHPHLCSPPAQVVQRDQSAGAVEGVTRATGGDVYIAAVHVGG